MWQSGWGGIRFHLESTPISVVMYLLYSTNKALAISVISHRSRIIVTVIMYTDADGLAVVFCATVTSHPMQQRPLEVCCS